jgi:ATP-dependent RNA helicase DDX5/DBP2
VKNQPPRQTREGPIVVVLLPTRELALQVLEVAQEYCRVTRLTVTCCYGGASKGAQSRELMSGKSDFTKNLLEDYAMTD